MLVRMKLDTSGVKLSLAQWNQLPEPDRRQLFELACSSPAEATSYRELLCDLEMRYAGEPVRLLETPQKLPWTDTEAVPAQLIQRSRDLGVTAPSLAQWRSLTPAQRFALLKLTRHTHESPRYLPALREFALI